MLTDSKQGIPVTVLFLSEFQFYSLILSHTILCSHFDNRAWEEWTFWQLNEEQKILWCHYWPLLKWPLPLFPFGMTVTNPVISNLIYLNLSLLHLHCADNKPYLLRADCNKYSLRSCKQAWGLSDVSHRLPLHPYLCDEKLDSLKFLLSIPWRIFSPFMDFLKTNVTHNSTYTC